MATAAKKTVRRPVKAADAGTAKASETTTAAANGAADVFAMDTITESARAQLDKFVSSFTDNTEVMREQAQDIVSTMRENVETASEHVQSFNAEIMAAAREEMTEAADFANELARAKTIGDAMELHQDYWTNLFETRMERFRDMTTETLDVVRKNSAPMNDAMSKMIKATPMDAFSGYFKK